jgi:hypothetical protein
MARGTQLSVALENKPGELARMAAVVARAKANIQAMSVADGTDMGVVRMVTSSNAKARAALKKAGMSVVQSPVIVAKLPNKPGALAAAAKKLAAAKVNIEYVYGSAGRAGEASTIVFGVSDIARAARVKL